MLDVKCLAPNDDPNQHHRAAHLMKKLSALLDFSIVGCPVLCRVFCLVLCLVSSTVQAFGQSNSGELHLQVTDPAGLGVKTTVQITSAANQYRSSLATNEQGSLAVQRLPYGIYQLEIKQPGFAPVSESLEIRVSVPTEHTIQLQLTALNQSVDVTAADTLIDPDRAGAVSEIGKDQIDERVSSPPGRSLQDLVNTQPGWIYEGNAVLHPRGSEYQTQFVVDGIPLTDNRSPSFGPEIEADDVQSMSIYTAGFPAEYGRKMGGVVEVNTLEDSQDGLHGQLVLSGGSFDSAGAFAQAQYVWGKNTLGASARGGMTDHYLNPVVPQNFSNTGTLGDFSVHYGAISRRAIASTSSFATNFRATTFRTKWCSRPRDSAKRRTTSKRWESLRTSTSFLHMQWWTFAEMVRDNSNSFHSNEDSTPIEVFQHNRFREGYFKGIVTINRGRHEWKFGVESDNTFLYENFRYVITDPTQFDPNTPPTLMFPLASQPNAGKRPDLEQSAFVQDLIHLDTWTISAGLRWDHYQLLLNRQAVEPRFAISRYFPSANLIVHFSYDRVFQTPSFENILLSSSTAVESIDPGNFLRLPVEPSEGNYYEVGATKAFFGKIRLDANYFRRLVNNYADDDQIQNTTISFPIAFRKSIIYGAEGTINVIDWRGFSGFVSYSWIVGNAWFPVTGGLFLGPDAGNAAMQLTGHFPDSQDQRNTVRGRVRYQVKPRFWVAAGIQFDSGLPFEFDGDPATVLAQYGQQVLDRINFARGRIYPAFQVNVSAGVDIYKSDRLNMRIQADGQNLTNVLNVIDFGGLFSGNAIGPPRSFALRLTTTF